MKPSKAWRRAGAMRESSEVVIVLADRTSVRGLITDARLDTAPFGAPGEMISGPASIRLTIEVQP